MRLVHWLAKRTCYTFAIALVSVLGGQVASLYGYLYFYGHYYIRKDPLLLRILPNALWKDLIFLLALVSIAHYLYFGLLRVFGLRWEARRLRIINDHIDSVAPRSTLSLQALSDLLAALSRLPLWNTMTAGVLGLALLLGMVAFCVLYTGNLEPLLPGSKQGW